MFNVPDQCLSDEEYYNIWFPHRPHYCDDDEWEDCEEDCEEED